MGDALVYPAAVAIAVGPWGVPFVRVAAATVRGLFSTFDILYIVFGAILLLHTLERSGAVRTILSGIPRHQRRPSGPGGDHRLDVGSFIEGPLDSAPQPP